ncbi:TPA: IS1595 family transposase [Neisseria meningitidis]|nr:IS1595 family transposase [Neisseria meningitidis]
MRKSRLSRYKQNKLIELFVAGVTARTATEPDSIVYMDCYRSYDVLDVSEFSHFRINHSTHFAERQNHINGIENFWSQAKRHLRKFNGIPKAHFELYLKECEWRFNNSEIKVQISILKQLVKSSLS